MKILKFIIPIMVFGLVAFTSCKDKDAEKRVAELEARLAELENGSSGTATATPAPAESKPTGPLPSFEWAAIEKDFGTLNEGDVVEHSFTFKNTGQAPLIIESAKPSCGCTVPDWSKEPIPVGGEGVIKVKFDSKGKPNVQNKTVTVTANTWPKVTTLRFKAFVTPAAN